MPGILSGNAVAPGDTLATTANYPASIFTHLYANGYKIDALEAATQICPQSICRLSASRYIDPAKFEHAMDFQNAKVRLTWGQTRGGLVAWARRQKFSPGTFVFRHFLTPHHPYDHLPSGQQYPSGPIPLIYPSGNQIVTAPIGNVRLSYQRLMLQVGYADRVIGELRKAARRQGVWKSMMLVVVGDHGLEHHPGRPLRTFQEETAGAVGFTPLFVKYPGKVSGGTSNLTTRGVDVFPTIASELGVPIPTVEGKPISDLSSEPRDVRLDGIELPFGQVAQSRREAVAFRDQLLGNLGLYKMGRATNLIGLKAGGKPSGKARLDDPGSYRSLGKKRAKVPALITGTVSNLRPGATVAISVNGVVRGTAEIFADAGRRRFGAMVNPRFFKQSNVIGVHAVVGGRLGRRLR